MNTKKRFLLVSLALVVTLGAAQAQTSLRVRSWGWKGKAQQTIPGDLGWTTAIAAGAYNTMAMRSDGSPVVWGRDGTRYGVPLGLTGALSIAASWSQWAAVGPGGSVLVWDSQGNIQPGIPAGLGEVVAVAAGGAHMVVLTKDGRAFAWGNNLYGQSVSPNPLEKFVAIAAGEIHTVALRDDGTVKAWGSDGWGQSSVPPGLADVVAIAAGSGHTVALQKDGIVKAWGRYEDGETLVPEGLRDVKAVAAGGNHTLALKVDGTVVAWGSNGSGESTIPDGLKDVVAVAAGFEHSVALSPTSVHGASASAIVINGFLVAIQVTDAGYGYSAPPRIQLIGGGGSGAKATAIIRDGAVASITVEEAGNDYTNAPGVRIASPDTRPEFTIRLASLAIEMKLGVNLRYQLISSENLRSWQNVGDEFMAQGEFLTNEVPTGNIRQFYRVVENAVSSSVPTQVSLPFSIFGNEANFLSGGWINYHGATAVAQVTNGFVVALTIVDGGFGYKIPPDIDFIGGGGSGARASATISEGAVIGGKILNAGRGYINPPAVVMAAPHPIPQIRVRPCKAVMEMKLSPGNRYQVYYSSDAASWFFLGESFVAEDDSAQIVFDVDSSKRHFRIEEVP